MARVFRTRAFGGRVVSLLGPHANEFVLLDQAKLFSSEQGWERIFGRLFPRGLMLMDFDEHRLHRKALSVAFKAGALKSYLERLNQGIAAGISGLAERLARSAFLSGDQTHDLRPRLRLLSRRRDGP